MDNPLRTIRLKYDYSIQELSSLIHCNNQLLYLVEQGCYSVIPRRILDYYFYEFLDESLSQLQNLKDNYRDFQKDKRFEFGTQVREAVAKKVEFQLDKILPPLLDEYGNVIHPCVGGQKTSRREMYEKYYWVSLLEEGQTQHCPVARIPINLNLTPTHFCKAICIQPALLYQLEHKKVSVVPSSIIEALEDAFFPDYFIEELQDQTESWLKNGR